MQEEGEFEVEAGSSTDSSLTQVDYSSPVYRNIAQIYAQRYQLKSDRIATMVNEEIDKTGRPALGVNQRQKGIWVLQATNMPAILVETGFINNPEDERYLNSEKGKDVNDALLDFNREKDIPYTDQVKYLAIPIPTYDLFNASSQDGSGQYRLYRFSSGFTDRRSMLAS